MSGFDFEYAIKKDVRNNPIVREVDEARQRQLWRTAGIGAVLVSVVMPVHLTMFVPVGVDTPATVAEVAPGKSYGAAANVPEALPSQLISP